MDVVASSQTLDGLTVETGAGGAVTALHAGVVVNVDYNNGSSASVSTSVNVWPLLTQRQQEQMTAINRRIERAVEEL